MLLIIIIFYNQAIENVLINPLSETSIEKINYFNLRVKRLDQYYMF